MSEIIDINMRLVQNGILICKIGSKLLFIANIKRYTRSARPLTIQWFDVSVWVMWWSTWIWCRRHGGIWWAGLNVFWCCVAGRFPFRFNRRIGRCCFLLCQTLLFSEFCTPILEPHLLTMTTKKKKEKKKIHIQNMWKFTEKYKWTVNLKL